MDDLRGTHTTFQTTFRSSPTPHSSPSPFSDDLKVQAFLSSQRSTFITPSNQTIFRTQESTVNGVVIGLLSSFGSAVLIAIIFLIVYFFRYTSRGRILLDRIGRPGEYDDEQAYMREEAEALEEMDDIQRTEYYRAKGISILLPFLTILYVDKLGGKY